MLFVHALKFFGVFWIVDERIGPSDRVEVFASVAVICDSGELCSELLDLSERFDLEVWLFKLEVAAKLALSTISESVVAGIVDLSPSETLLGRSLLCLSGFESRTILLLALIGVSGSRSMRCLVARNSRLFLRYINISLRRTSGSENREGVSMIGTEFLRLGERLFLILLNVSFADDIRFTISHFAYKFSFDFALIIILFIFVDVRR